MSISCARALARCAACICEVTPTSCSVLVHTGGFNLGLLMRRLISVGTPGGLQERLAAVVGALIALAWRLWTAPTRIWPPDPRYSSLDDEPTTHPEYAVIDVRMRAFTTGC